MHDAHSCVKHRAWFHRGRVRKIKFHKNIRARLCRCTNDWGAGRGADRYTKEIAVRDTCVTPEDGKGKGSILLFLPLLAPILCGRERR